MSADKKVRQHAGANSTSTAILSKSFACEKTAQFEVSARPNVGDP